MKIFKLNELALSETIEICVEHNNERLVWSTEIFDKAAIRKGFNPDSVFEHLNLYWSRLLEGQQQVIFNLYRDIKLDFESVFSRAELASLVTPKVAKLLDAHEFPHVRRWVEIESDIIIPASLKSDYVDNRDRSGTREQTYLRGEYIDLATMAVILRAMIPIWGEFIYRNKRDVNNTYKEYYAVELIARSKLFNSPAMARLHSYIENNFPKDKSLASHVIGGLSQQEVPNWLLALVLARRLTMGDLKNPNPSHTLISYIFKFVFHRLQSSDGNFAGEIKKKEPEIQKDDGGISVLESFKMKQEVPTGHLVIIESSMRDVHRLHQILEPTIDTGRLQLALKTTNVLHTKNIEAAQVQLLQWIVKPVVSPRGVMHLNKTTLVSTLALAQEYLWYHGFHFMACYLSSYVMPRTDEHVMSGTDTRSRIPKEVLDELARYYPYDQRPKQRSAAAKRTSTIVDVIDKMAADISDRIWISTMIPQDTEKAIERPGVKRLVIPQDIKLRVAELVLHVAKVGERNYQSRNTPVTL